jgi:CDP-diacylglycerol--serine O-phosphatidyltransferase
MLWWFGERDHAIGEFKWVLPPLMLFLSVMMFSRLRYPSFKAVTWRTTRSLSRFLVIAVVLLVTVLNYEWMPAVLFLVYLLYGLVRPWVSKAWQREIEEEIGEEHRSETAEESPEISG